MSERHGGRKLAEIVSDTERRQIIESDAQKLLTAQSEGTFTYRCIDCCHNPMTFLKGAVMPCVMNGQIAEEIGVGPYRKHCLLCLLSPFFAGSYMSVGKNKQVYRTQNSIPGLPSDDYMLGCVFPWCIIVQLRNQLDEFEREKKTLEKTKAQMIAIGQAISRE